VPLAALLTIFEIIGVWCGVFIAHSIDGRHLRRAVGVLCILVGIGLMIRSFTNDSTAPRPEPPLVRGQPYAAEAEVATIDRSSGAQLRRPKAFGPS
jgi:uncharacterized membrane protein YfcA